MKGIKLIPLDERGSVAIINASDFKKVSAYKWHKSDTGYAVWRGIKNGVKQTVRMHRLIADAPKDLVVDHLNNNPLDNRANNLRVCTQKENSNNRKDVKGYAWDKSKNKWIVSYKSRFYGRYTTEEEAQKAYQLACSGVPYIKQRRKLWHLPKGITKQFGMYKVRPQRNNHKYWLGMYKTLDEAKTALERFNKGETQEYIHKPKAKKTEWIEFDSYNAKRGKKPYRVRFQEQGIKRTRIFLTKNEADNFMKTIQEQQR